MRKLLALLDNFFFRYVVRVARLVFARTSVLETDSQLKRILLIKFVGLGDAVLITHTINSLRKRHPSIVVDLLTGPQTYALWKYKLNLVDDVHFVSFNGLSFFKIFKLILNLRAKRYDVVVDFELRSYLSQIIVGLINPHASLCLDNQHLNRSIVGEKKYNFNGDMHIIDQYYSLCRPLLGEDKIELFDYRSWIINLNIPLPSSFLKSNNLVVCCHVGVGFNMREREWPLDYLADVCRYILLKFEQSVVNIFGGGFNGREAILLKNKIGEENNHRIALVQNIELISYIKALTHTDLFISNDTGPIHLAYSLDVKTIGIYGPETPQRYGPYFSQKKSIGLYKPTICSPCINHHLRKPNGCRNHIYQECMYNIHPKDLINTINDYIT